MENNSIKSFIEDAIAGGWKEGEESKWRTAYNCLSAVFLDPLAWRAVGKTRGWEALVADEFGNEELRGSQHYKHQMEMFIRKIADGKTIDEALKLISS